MFTGLIETMGVIHTLQKGNKSLSLGILPDNNEYEVAIGGSVAVNGACLTVESVSGCELFFTAVYETLKNTTLARIKIGDRVNLERAMRLSDRLEGHVVLGHVDGVGRIVSDTKSGDSILRKVWVPSPFRKFMARKGSVAIDGISLTIVDSSDENVSVSFIPHTLSKTTMAKKRAGHHVNIECDIFARYIEKQLHSEANSSLERNDKGIISLLEDSGF